MKRISAVVALALFLGFGLLPGSAQFTARQVAERDAREQFLLTAEIVGTEPIGQGVTKPLKAYLRKEGVEGKACWKNPSGKTRGVLDRWQYEIAAYRLDKLIGLNMVPVAVERALDGKPGALVDWAENKYSLRKMVDDGIVIPDPALEHTEKMKWLARAWDSLVANEDRTQENVLYTEDWRMILFDHSRAFRSTRPFTRRLMFGRNGIKLTADGKPLLFRRLPRWFPERIEALTFESIRAAVGATLEDKEIEAILARRGLLLKEIAAMIKEQGEAAVLY